MSVQIGNQIPLGSEKVRLANGSLTPISGLGTTVVSPSLSLSSMLIVPSFPSNLLSVSSLTALQSHFLSNNSLLKDLRTGRTIGGEAPHCPFSIMGEKNVSEIIQDHEQIPLAIPLPSPATLDHPQQMEAQSSSINLGDSKTDMEHVEVGG